MKKFIILMPSGRVGSNLLTEALNQQLGVVMENEQLTVINNKYKIFQVPHGHDVNPNLAVYGLDYESIVINNVEPSFKEILAKADNEQKDYMVYFFGSSFHKEENYYVGGIKLAYNNILSKKYFIDKIEDNDIPIVLMIRKNVVKTALSFEKARLSKQWGVRDKDDPMRRLTLTLEPSNFKKKIKLVDQVQETMLSVFKNYSNKMLIEYKEIQVHYDDIVSSACEFVGIDNLQIISPSFYKSTSDDLRSVIENFDEIHESIKGTKYEEMLLEK